MNLLELISNLTVRFNWKIFLHEFLHASLMFPMLRVCAHCQKINLNNVGRVVYSTSRPYIFGRRSRDYQLGRYLKPLMFTTTVCINHEYTGHYTLKDIFFCVTLTESLLKKD